MREIVRQFGDLTHIPPWNTGLNFHSFCYLITALTTTDTAGPVTKETATE